MMFSLHQFGWQRRQHTGLFAASSPFNSLCDQNKNCVQRSGEDGYGRGGDLRMQVQETVRNYHIRNMTSRLRRGQYNFTGTTGYNNRFWHLDIRWLQLSGKILSIRLVPSSSLFFNMWLINATVPYFRCIVFDVTKCTRIKVDKCGCFHLQNWGRKSGSGGLGIPFLSVATPALSKHSTRWISIACTGRSSLHWAHIAALQ